MSQDNLLLGISGALEGFKDAFVPLMQQKQKYNLENQLQAAQNTRTLDRESQLSTQKNSQDLAREKELELMKEKQQTTLESQKDYVTGQELLDLDPTLNVEPDRKYNTKALSLLKHKGDLSKAQQDQVAAVKTARDKVLELKTASDQAAGGWMGGVASLASRFPVLRNFAPDATNYERNLPQAGLLLNSALIGGKRPTNAGLQADASTLPPLDFPRSQRNENFTRVLDQLNKREAEISGVSIAPGNSDPTAKATKFLQDHSMPVTPANIKHAIDKGYVN